MASVEVKCGMSIVQLDETDSEPNECAMTTKCGTSDRGGHSQGNDTSAAQTDQCKAGRLVAKISHLWISENGKISIFTANHIVL
jgi:hypothetical protein